MESHKNPICSFCRKPASGDRRIVLGPGTDCAICEECISFAEELLNGRVPKGQTDGSCAFCGKTSEEVERLVYGPGTNICDSCISFAGKQLE